MAIASYTGMVTNVRPGLRDIASWLPLGSRNLGNNFQTIPVLQQGLPRSHG